MKASPSYKEGKDGLWYWHFESKNGKILADGGEGYDSKSNAKRGFKRFVKLAADYLGLCQGKE
jgi:uncharacterized protein YegP (UPF0339 family)